MPQKSTSQSIFLNQAMIFLAKVNSQAFLVTNNNFNENIAGLWDNLKCMLTGFFLKGSVGTQNGDLERYFRVRSWNEPHFGLLGPLGAISNTERNDFTISFVRSSSVSNGSTKTNRFFKVIK